MTSICQIKIESKYSTTPRDKLVRPVRHNYFLWWCSEWNLRGFQSYCASFSGPVNFNFSHFPNCKLYHHYWISILGASETESFKSTPDFSEWPRSNLTWVTVDETWLDCGSLFFLFHNSGTPVDPTLSSRCDTIGTNHNWTGLWFLIFDERRPTYPAHQTTRL